VQLVEVTIDSLAEVGYVGTTLAEIARAPESRRDSWRTTSTTRTDCSKPPPHTRAYARGAGAGAARAGAHARGRVQAVIDTNLAPEDSTSARHGVARLLGPGVARARSETGPNRLQRRMLSNLRNDLRG